MNPAPEDNHVEPLSLNSDLPAVKEIPAYMAWVWAALTASCVLPMFVTLPYYSRAVHAGVGLLAIASLIPTIFAGRRRIMHFVRNVDLSKPPVVEWPERDKQTFNQ